MFAQSQPGLRKIMYKMQAVNKPELIHRLADINENRTGNDCSAHTAGTDRFAQARVVQHGRTMPDRIAVLPEAQFRLVGR